MIITPASTEKIGLGKIRINAKLSANRVIFNTLFKMIALSETRRHTVKDLLHSYRHQP